MRRFLTLLPVLARVTVAQGTTLTGSVTPLATPDALPLTDLRDIDVPTYTSTPGLDSDIVYYATATAIAAAAADVSESPLSVFPAVTSVPINAAGEDGNASPTATGNPSKRDVDKRTACAPQATISNYYKINVDSYSAFKADPTIASVANAAPTPSGYFNNFKNAAGANSAYAYLGYAIVNSGKTGYDVNWCANKCNAISGCLSFNIYFERDPTLEPGTGCTNPAAFANIKCSFWGSALDSKTANNYGQYRADFQVGIAGSNAYTSYKLGGPIDGWSIPQNLNTSVMNAPLRDCYGTWTYMGYKIFQSGPYDPQLCSAACDAQTAYNLAHPPSDSKAPKCAAFGTYLLSMTNKTGTYLQGQMCTMYTSNWDKQYAVNNVAYDDSIGAKYTYSYSFFYSKPDIQPVCKSDISYLLTSGADFCTSFISYSAPSTTSTTTITPVPTTAFMTTTVTTSTVILTSSPTTSVTASLQWRKRDSTDVDNGNIMDSGATPTTVASVPVSSAVILATYAETFTAPNGTAPTDAPANIIAKRAVLDARAIATPASITGWSPAKISEACSDVATGTITVTASTTLTPATSTTFSSATAVTTLQACVVPSELPDYTTFTPVWGVWSGDQLGDNPSPKFRAEANVQIPFPMTIGGYSSNVITVGTNGYIKVGSSAQVVAFADQGYNLYIYGGRNGVFYRITGPVGSRQVVFAWYAGTYNYGHMQNHFTITYFEDKPGVVQYKYYDVVQSGLYQAWSGVVLNGVRTNVLAYQAFSAGQQFTVTTGSDNSVTSASSTHNRIDCCLKDRDAWWGGWHSCTEFQPAIAP